MPAEKTARVQERRRKINRQVQSTTRTLLKTAKRLIKEGEREPAAKAVSDAVSSLDRAARKGVVHRNNAARHKSSLMRGLNSAGAAVEEKDQTIARPRGRATAKVKAGSKARKKSKSS